MPGTPASLASEHPSPSLSKSNLFGVPSASVSNSVQGVITPALLEIFAAINLTSVNALTNVADP